MTPLVCTLTLYTSLNLLKVPRVRFRISGTKIQSKSGSTLRAILNLPNQEDKNGVLAKQGLCPLPTTGVLTKTAKMTNGHSIHKNKGFAPQTPENDENDELSVTHAKTLFAKNPVFAPLTEV